MLQVVVDDVCRLLMPKEGSPNRYVNTTAGTNTLSQIP